MQITTKKCYSGLKPNEVLYRTVAFPFREESKTGKRSTCYPRGKKDMSRSRVSPDQATPGKFNIVIPVSVV